MGTVIQLRDYLNDGWKEVFATDGPNSSLQVYVNKRTGEAEIVQMNDDNECIRTPLNPEDALILVSTLGFSLGKQNKPQIIG